MTVHFYSSADVGAPALRGNSPGDMIALLTACLVNGYGSKSGAGWTREFANPAQTIAAFKQGLGSNGMYLRVDDTQLLAAQGNRNANVVGYEQMSDLNTGLPSPFPTEAQNAGGLRWATLYNASASWTARDTARVWYVIADESGFYFWIFTHPTVGAATLGYRELYYFGDINSLDPADVTHTVLMGQVATGNSVSSGAPCSNGAATLGAASSGLFIARSRSGETSATSGHHGDTVKQGTASWGGTGGSSMLFPNPSDNALWMTPLWVHEPGSRNLRGTFPGFWPSLCSPTGIDTGDQFDGQGQQAGKRFLVLRIYLSYMYVELTGDWGR